MDIEALLKSLGDTKPKNTVNDVGEQIERLTLRCAAQAGGASQAASAIVTCMLAAAIPLMRSLFNSKMKASAQDRLLFSLVLAGAVTTVEEDDRGIDSTVEISPANIRDALDTYTKLTGKDMAPYLPKQMVAFADKSSALN